MWQAKRRKEVTDNATTVRCPIAANRIVNFDVFANNMNCVSCKSSLFLQDIQEESRKGLASIIRCRECLSIDAVPSGKTQACQKSRKKMSHRFASYPRRFAARRYRARIEKFPATLDVPALSSETLKKHQRQMENAVELASEESCKDSARLETSAGIEN